MTAYLPWLRARTGPVLLPLVYATAIVQDDSGRILFQRRADFGDAWWGLPGGLLDPGETLEQCAQREVFEETGLEVETTRLTGVYSSPRYAVTYPNGDQAQQVTFCYACRVRGGALRPQAAEILELAYFEPAALPPRPHWYADMIDHFQAGMAHPYFDPPSFTPPTTPYPTLLALRGLVGAAPLIWPGATAAVLDDGGRLLLQRRSDNGQWGLPAGALDVGETLAQTARRETREEAGLDVEPVRVLMSYAGYQVVLNNGHVLWPVGTLFACRRVGGEPRPDGVESTAVRYFARHELPPLPPHIQPRAEAAFAGALPLHSAP